MSRRLGHEAGFAVPTVMLATVAAFGLAATAVVASIGAQSGTVRDQNAKQALAAAEAGVANALLRFNRIRTISVADACLPVGGTIVGADGWCPNAVTGSIDRGTYTYRVRPTPASGSTPAQIKVVSAGAVDGVGRRVSVTADTVSEGYRPFDRLASVIGLDSIFLNSRARITADVATNGNIGLSSGSVLDCRYAQVGVGKGFIPNDGTATCPPTPGTISLPPVNPGDVAVKNENTRICISDPCSKVTWDPLTKRLRLGAGGSITLGTPGGTFNYAFCKLTLDANSYLHVAAGATVRIYFLAPEMCANESEPFVLHSGSAIAPTGTEVADLALLIVGSDSQPTAASFNADSILFDCNQRFVLYAPRTAVTLNSRTTICGGLAAKSIAVNEQATITASADADEFELPNEQVASHYGEPHDFVECSSMQPTAAPDSGC